MKKRKILIADDDDHIKNAIADLLEEAGYEFEAVSNGEEALKALNRENFDLALLDVMMPKMDGYHLAAQINGLPKKPKVVIMTSRDYDKDERTVQSVGAAAFLSKPFANKELLNLVRNLLK